MCITGDIPDNPNNLRHKPISESWKRFAACPFRLFTLASLIHTFILFVLVVSDSLPYGYGNTHSILFIAFYGLLSAPVLGALVYWMPRRFERPPVSYRWYFLGYLLILISLGLAELGLMYSKVWIIAGAALLALGWYTVIYAFHDYSALCAQNEKIWLRLFSAGLHLGLLGISVFAAGILADSLLLTGSASWGFFLAAAISLLTALIQLRRIRSISTSDSRAHCLTPRIPE